VIMGGSAGRGNTTPAAEYNMWADPEAAAVVFQAGWSVVMLGLDVTLRTGAGPAVRERMRELGPLGAELLLPALEHYRSVHEPAPEQGGRGGLGGKVSPQDRGDPGGSPPGAAGPAVHDVCTVAWIAQPTLFGLVPARVQVETAGQLTSGMTVTDFAAPGPADSSNARVAMDIDVDGFWELALGTYRRLAQAMAAEPRDS
jgi:inosine-uridine nucleoside N-ribohydrolase